MALLYWPESSHAAADEQLFQHAQSQQQRQNYRQALNGYRAYLATQPFSVYKRLAKARVAVLEKGLAGAAPDAALQDYIAALDSRDDGRYDVALQHLDRVIQTQPASAFYHDARYLHAYILLMDRFDYAGALTALNELIEQQPGPYKDTALYGKALALEHLGRGDQAKSVLAQLRNKHSIIPSRWLQMYLPKSNFTSRLWFERASQRLKQIEQREHALENAAILIGGDFGVAIGARYSYDQPVGSGRGYQYSWNLLQKHQLPATHLTHWYTRRTDWRWESSAPLKAASTQGLTPVISHWWFGDEISKQFVRQHRADYMRNIRKQLIPVLQQLQDAIVLLEPEYNKKGIQHWGEWDDVASEAIRTIKQQAPHVRVGLTIGDWAEFENRNALDNIREAVDLSDFVGFMLMTSASNEGADLNPVWSVRERLTRAARALAARFDKPLYLGYAALSSAGKWELRQAEYLRQIMSEAPLLANYGVFGVGYFSLFDNPAQVGWFGDAENYFGLLDANGFDKPAAHAWRQSFQTLKNSDQSPPQVNSENITTDARQVAIEYGFSEWVRWQLQLRGATSGATRHFAGAGNQLAVNWAGGADHREFADEAVTVQLQLTDKGENGHTINRKFDWRCTPNCNPVRHELLGVQATSLATRNGASYQYKSDGSVKMEFRRPHSSVIIGAPEAGLNHSDQIRLSIDAEADLQGISIGLIDGSHYQATLPLQMMEPGRESGGRDYLIPLRDIPNNARRFGSNGSQVQFGDITFSEDTRIIIEQRVGSSELTVRGLSVEKISNSEHH